MSVEQKLAALGFSLPQPAAPVASYVPAVRTGNLVFTSGQLPTKEGTVERRGKVGAEVIGRRGDVSATGGSGEA